MRDKQTKTIKRLSLFQLFVIECSIHFNQSTIVMKTLQRIKNYLRICQFCGITCISLQLNKRSSSNTFRILFNLANILIFSAVFVLCFIYQEYFTYEYNNLLIKLNDFVELASPIFVHVVILLEGVCCRRFDRRILFKIHQLETLIVGNRTIRVRLFILRSFIVFVIGLMIDVSVLISIQPGKWQNSYLIRLTSYIIIRVNLIQIILLISYITDQLKYLSLQLRRIESMELTLKDAAHSQATIKRLQKSHHILVELTMLINRRFGWSQTMSLFNSGLAITVGVYWVWVRIRFHLYTNIIEASVCMIPAFIQGLIIFEVIQECVNQSKRLSADLHRLQRTRRNVMKSETIRLFSYQILMFPIEFTANNFFVINYSALRDVKENVFEILRIKNFN